MKKDWLLYGTDKSGKMILVTKKNYLLVQENHAAKDKIASLEEVAEFEEKIYLYSRALCKILSIGRGLVMYNRRRGRNASRLPVGDYLHWLAV